MEQNKTMNALKMDSYFDHFLPSLGPCEGIRAQVEVEGDIYFLYSADLTPLTVKCEQTKIKNL